MDEKERNERASNEQQSQNVLAKLWRLFTRGLSWLLILPILFIASSSPFTPPSCRFTPSCSEYGRQAILKHGPFKDWHLQFGVY